MSKGFRVRRRRSVVATASLAIALVASVSAAAAPLRAQARTATCRAPLHESFSITGPVHACGASLVDSAGHRVRLLSYELLSMYPGDGDRPDACAHWHAPPSDLAGKLKAWGMNSVQILLSWANLEPTRPTRTSTGSMRHHWNQSYLQALDTAIGEFRDAGVAVVLSLGQSRWSSAFRNLRLPNGLTQPCGLGMPVWLYPHGGSTAEMVRAERRFFSDAGGVQKKFRGAWRMLAARYAHYRTVVGAEMLFEAYDLIAMPYLGVRTTPSQLNLAAFYERLGRAIHEANPRLLTMYADWQSHDGRLFAVERRPQLMRSVYSYEFYGSSWDAPTRARFDRYRLRASGWTAPAWIDEFTAFNYGLRGGRFDVDPQWKLHTQQLLAEARSHRIGWSFLGSVNSELAAVLKAGH